jgi:hypothetical protein
VPPPRSTTGVYPLDIIVVWRSLQANWPMDYVRFHASTVRGADILVTFCQCSSRNPGRAKAKYSGHGATVELVAPQSRSCTAAARLFVDAHLVARVESCSWVPLVSV